MHGENINGSRSAICYLLVVYTINEYDVIAIDIAMETMHRMISGLLL